MSVKLLRRGAIAGVIVLAAATWSTQAAFGASSDEPPVTEAPTAVTAEPSASDAAETAPEITVTIPEISLDGPAIAEVEITVQNDSDAAMRSVSLVFRGPVGWQVAPERADLDSIKSGKSTSATFQLRIPEERPGFALRSFTATATYKGGDGAGSVSATRAIPTGPPLDELALAYNNVGITSESQPAPGNFDGEGNSFSAEKLAAADAGKGAAIEALGATLHMPAVEPGTADNVTTAGQAVRVSGQGERLVFLGSGSNFGATGAVTVFYTDGTSSVGNIGFPNWSFQEANAHGAELAVSTDGRNRPNGYGDSVYQYRLFAHSVPITAGKTVDFVILPTNAAVHIFSMGIAP